MIEVRILLTVSTIAIYTLTVIAIVAHGWNWPLIAINDLLALNWRSQFDFDFIIHLLLLGSWVVWREGGEFKSVFVWVSECRYGWNVQLSIYYLRHVSS